jgi:hypothetical protein
MGPGSDDFILNITKADKIEVTCHVNGWILSVDREKRESLVQKEIRGI